jgi:dihydroorotate dehydrogenase electron transfer subunit
MQTSTGAIAEIFLEGRHAARLTCPPGLIPAPGQYVLATCDGDPDSALARAIFPSGTCVGGFYSATRLPALWLPGAGLSLRGPFGRGFHLPGAARRVALASFGESCGRVLALLEAALAQGAELTVLSDRPPAGLPARVEISPLAALPEAARWADYLAIEIGQEQVRPRLAAMNAELNSANAQILVETALPCAGAAACGVCAVKVRAGYLLACKDGPVFDLGLLDLRV